MCVVFFFSSRRRHTIFDCDWSSDVCSSDLHIDAVHAEGGARLAAAALIGGRQVLGARHGTHAAPAAAADGLDHDAAGAPGLLRLEEGLGLFQRDSRSEEHTSELQSQSNLVCRLLLEKKKKNKKHILCLDIHLRDKI